MSSDEAPRNVTRGAAILESDVHGLGDRHGDPLRVLQCQALRHQLADEQREVGDEPDDEDHRDRLAVRGDGRDTRQVPRHWLGERRAAVEAGHDADEGDADLNGRQKSVGMLGQPERHRGAFVTFFRPLLQPRLA